MRHWVGTQWAADGEAAWVQATSASPVLFRASLRVRLCIAVLSLACSWYLKGQSADENIEVWLHVRTELPYYKVDAVRLGENVFFAVVGFEKPCFFVLRFGKCSLLTLVSYALFALGGSLQRV